MQTALIRIEKASGDPPGHAIRLYRIDEGGAVGQPLAEERMPVDWAAENPPLHPQDRKPLDVATIQQLVLDFKESSTVFAEIGAFLYGLVARGDVGRVWAALRAQYAREDPPRSEGLRTMLDIDAPELWALPWELMYSHPWRLFIDVRCPMVRGRIDLGRAPTLRHLPFRVLVVVGCRPDDRVIQWSEELQGIEEALRGQRQAVDFDVVRQPSAPELTRALHTFKPDVLHFIGHGRGGAGETPSLEVEAKDAKWLWTVDKIVVTLHDHPPRLAFLNACHSSHQGVQNGFWSVARAFESAGTLAVIGMHADIEGRTAATFGRRVYEALAEGRPLDAALADARREVSDIPERGLDFRDWSLACLAVSVPPEQVLPFHPCVPPTRLAEIRKEFEQLEDFVDRRDERRRIWSDLDGLNGETARDLAIVLGEDEVGKTTIVRWYLEAVALRGHRVAYRTFKSQGTLRFLHALRVIRDGDPEAAWTTDRELPADAFGRFNQALNALLSGRPSPGPEAPLEDSKDRNLELKAGPEDLIASIFAAFLPALQAAGGGAPLTVALDQLTDPGGGILQDDFDLLRTNLINPVARRQLRPVRLVIAVTPREYEKLKLDAVAAQAMEIRVPAFAPKDFRPLAEEFLRHHMTPEESLALVNALAPKVDKSWKLGVLRELHEGIQRLRGGA